MSITTPNMGLTVPTASVELGPAYANQINGDLGTIDTHDHSPGKGVPVTSGGINVNADLTFGNNNLTNGRSVRFYAQSSPLALTSDLTCVYASGVDLYYNDGNGNQVRITQSGGVAGSPGSITGLVSPASATYVAGNQTFVWQSDVNTPANLDAGAVVFRNITSGSNGITMAAPAGLATNYSLTLPALPAVKGFLTLDSSGVISAATAFTAGILGSSMASGTITATNISSSAGIAGVMLADAAGLTPNQMGLAYSSQGVTTNQSLTGTGGVVSSLTTVVSNSNPNNVRPVFVTFGGGFLTLSTVNVTTDITVTVQAVVGITPHSVAAWTLPGLTLANSPRYFPMSAFNCIDPNWNGSSYRVLIAGTQADSRMVVTSAIMQLVQV